MNLKIKVGDIVKTSKTPAARKSMKAMSIDHYRAGAVVTITQKAEVGVSFKFGARPFSTDKEWHVSADHAVNIFPNEKQNKKT